MGADGYMTEGFVGNYSCASCKTKINVYRAVEQTASTTKDYLRFEQTIEGGTGRCVLQVPLTFEKEFVAMKKGLTAKKVLGTPCACDVVKEQFFASCKCVGCGKVLSFWNQVKRCEETGTLRWFLSRKEDKVLEEKVLDDEGEFGDGEKYVDNFW